MNPSTTLRGKQITDGLRENAARPSGKFELAPNSEKDLLEMKLLSNCSDEAQSCMAAIGKELGADFLIYGTIERKQNGYFVSLKMLDTKTAKMVKTKSGTIPFSNHAIEQLRGHASSMYRGLTGEPEQGVLVLKVKNADKGTVYLDGEIRTSLAAGSATIRDISEGKHMIAIESDGFERYSKEVKVGGKSQELSITLEEIGSSSGGGRGLYKGLAIGGAVLAVGGAVGLVLTGTKVTSAEDDKNAVAPLVLAELENDPAFDPAEFNSDACAHTEVVIGSATPSPDQEALLDACDTGKSNQTLFNFVFLPTTIVGAIAAGYFGYRGFLASDDDVLEEQAYGKKGKRKPRRRVKIQPLFGPNGVAASVRVEF